ncbi:tyrosine-protein phosphatase [Ancylobacter dichloromethanicus]
MKDAKKPILIHCQAGADRSGLASALYLAAIKKNSAEAEAEAQLSIRYGHFFLCPSLLSTRWTAHLKRSNRL